MHKDLHEYIQRLGSEDNDREDRLGTQCPMVLELWLSGGHVLRDVCLIDGENSVDDRSIDLKPCNAPRTSDEVMTVPIAHIVMLKARWPSEADEARAVREKSK